MQFSNGHYMNLFLSTYFVLKNKFLSFSSKKKKKKKIESIKKTKVEKKSMLTITIKAITISLMSHTNGCSYGTG